MKRMVSCFLFACDGQLWGVTGDGAIVPECLYKISTVDGSTTFHMELGNGSQGEAIAFQDGSPTATEMSTWGGVKSLYR